MKKAFSFLISAGLIALGTAIVAGPKLEFDSLSAWTLMGLLTAGIGVLSFALELRDARPIH